MLGSRLYNFQHLFKQQQSTEQDTGSLYTVNESLQIFPLVLVCEFSNMTWGVLLCSLPATSQHPPLSCIGVTHQNVPLLGMDQPRDPAATPLLEYHSICPPCGSPFKQCKAIFFQHQHFSKADQAPGEYIIIASQAHLLEQHLGGGFHSFQSSHHEGNSCPAILLKNPAAITSC